MFCACLKASLSQSECKIEENANIVICFMNYINVHFLKGSVRTVRRAIRCTIRYGCILCHNRVHQIFPPEFANGLNSYL